MQTQIKKRILALSLLTILLIAFVAVKVSAEPTSVAEDIGNFFSKLFSGEKVDDNTRLGISRILLIILVVLLVYSVTDFLPFIPQNKEGIKWLIAIIVGLLSFMFVTMDSIRYILVNYEALGVMLTSVFPLIILMVFTIKLHENEPGIAIIVNKLLIVGFIIYAIWQWISIRTNDNSMAWIYIITILISLIWLFMEGTIQRWWRRARTRDESERTRDTVNAATNAVITMAGMNRNLGGGLPPPNY